ncbi:flagellar export chaperone FliS [Candidatus Haliotispira prima]|uniref:Flagellar secretion chaperone FliS n=1 Tax=Candidatus Haliotispira prima TaxID=3034016 RepID=A0ABY8MHA9_9SPIO|nr:flagellar export chaperone FliS [Candidatus Haliotispira prima]
MYQNLQRYRKNDVVTANQGRLIVMLYDGLIKQIDLGTAELRKEGPRLDLAHNALTKAQEILNELQISLDIEHGGQIAQSLLSLYRFFAKALIQANINKNSEGLPVIRQQIADLRDAWAQVQTTQCETPKQPAVGVNIAG